MLVKTKKEKKDQARETLVNIVNRKLCQAKPFSFASAMGQIDRVEKNAFNTSNTSWPERPIKIKTYASVDIGSSESVKMGPADGYLAGQSAAISNQHSIDDEPSRDVGTSNSFDVSPVAAILPSETILPILSHVKSEQPERRVIKPGLVHYMTSDDLYKEKYEKVQLIHDPRLDAQVS